MNTLLLSNKTFLEGMSEDVLLSWFQTGVTKYYTAKSNAGDKAIHGSCVNGAFEGMALTFGSSQHHSTLFDEFVAIYGKFSQALQEKFKTVLGKSIIEFIKTPKSYEIIKELIELALEIKHKEMADILAEFLPGIQDTNLKYIMHMHGAGFFEESRYPDSISRLIQVCLADPNLPPEISLQLIIARVRNGTEAILIDLGKLDKTKVHNTYNNLKTEYPGQYKKFRRDLRTACKKIGMKVADILGALDL